MNYKTMSIDDIIKYCQDNDQVAWLKETASKMSPCKVYPKVKDPETGRMKADRTKPYTTEMRPITFIQLKGLFCAQFMPEILPKAKEKKATMYDRIASL